MIAKNKEKLFSWEKSKVKTTWFFKTVLRLLGAKRLSKIRWSIHWKSYEIKPVKFVCFYYRAAEWSRVFNGFDQGLKKVPILIAAIRRTAYYIKCTYMVRIFRQLVVFLNFAIRQKTFCRIGLSRNNSKNKQIFTRQIFLFTNHVIENRENLSFH